MTRHLAVWMLLAALGAGSRLLLAAPGAAWAQDVAISPETNYLLGCGGCHGENGVSNAKLVPVLTAITCTPGTNWAMPTVEVTPNSFNWASLTADIEVGTV